MAKTYSLAEVAKHKVKGDMWLAIDGKVYDISGFAEMHPGGEGVLTPYAGTDATDIFFELHRVEVLKKYSKLVIGVLETAKGPAIVDVQMKPGALSKVPYAEPPFWQGQPSAFFNESHRKYRVAFRALLDEHMVPLIPELERSGKTPPHSLFKVLGKGGVLLSRLGPGPWMDRAFLDSLGITLPGNLDPKEFDAFHELIAHQEIARTGSPAVCDGIGAGFVISIPLIMHFAQPEVRKRVGAECLTGDKRTCLAVTEPFVGSDVAKLRTTAALSPCGKFYIVNGVKKWITSGMDADYFVTAVRTGGPGADGISCLLVERTQGLTTNKIDTAYGSSGGTAYVIYDNVKVPVGNLLGELNKGFKCFMFNFNHERWFSNCLTTGAVRMVLEETFKWTVQRKVFGKALVDQMSVRQKLGYMFAGLEASESWLYQITFAMKNMTYKQQEALAGEHALLKNFLTRHSWHCADQCAQIFGGRALTKTGMGRKVELYLRSVKYGAILAGSEEIMTDFGVRWALKSFPKTARL